MHKPQDGEGIAPVYLQIPSTAKFVIDDERPASIIYRSIRSDLFLNEVSVMHKPQDGDGIAPIYLQIPSTAKYVIDDEKRH
jgi:hypothetical protein